MLSINLRGNSIFAIFIVFSKKDLSGIEDITFAMRNRQEWFNEKRTSGFPNLTLKSIAEFSTAHGEPLIKVTE